MPVMPPDLPDTARLRPSEWVMDPRRAAAAYPNALSFSRSLLRRMQRERWRITRLRIELDRDGRGEALYQVDAGGHAFHFFAISKYFPADEKVDRSFGINWDVSAAVCQGPWTREREDVLREEIPKQYDGRYDADVLCFCRGNRSERIFDEVVDALAEGHQPDTAMLASVGYILRSTAFAGNGLFGMKPFEGLGDDHPLRRTYHVQILSAFLLREFVFDLVDAMARARGDAAVPLHRSLKRYLGVGNSAGLGLIPFLANHPRIIDRWVRTHEQALAMARARMIEPASPEAGHFVKLIARARTYFGEDPRDGNGIFAPFERLAAEFATVEDRTLGALASGAPVAGGALVDAATDGLHVETVEVVNFLLLELHPDIVEWGDDHLVCDETLDVRPEMSCGELTELAHRSYGWLIREGARSPGETAHFWYYPVEAPYEPRRGLRGREPSREMESPMDLPGRLDAVLAVLAAEPPDIQVGTLLARRPDLRAIVARIQSTADLDYAELRQNYCASDFTPFAACRFLLSFYGMEKFDPRPPRSTKGALLQGAPLADEVVEATPGEWPFPLLPQLPVARSASAPRAPLRSLESPETTVAAIKKLAAQAQPVPRDATHLFPLELRKLTTKAALTRGCDLGTAELLAQAAQLSLTMGTDNLAAILSMFEGSASARWLPRFDGHGFDAPGIPTAAALPSSLDLACAVAWTAGSGLCRIRGATSSPMVGPSLLRVARRGLLVIVADPDGPRTWVAGGEANGSWLARFDGLRPGWTAPDAIVTRGSAIDALLAPGGSGGDLVALCVDTPTPARPPTGATLAWTAESIAVATRTIDASGIPVTQADFARLSHLGKSALVPEDVEKRIVPA